MLATNRTPPIVCVALTVCGLLVLTGARGGNARLAAQSPGQISHAQMNAIVQGVQQEFGALPGVAVAVVQANGAVALGSFGYRDVERRLPVTPSTQFAIASLTKSFVAAAFRLAAETGEVDLDAPLSSLLSDLQLPAPLNPDHVALRDLLVHRSGIQNDAISFRTSMSADVDSGALLDLFARGSVPVSRSFQYSNVGYILAAQAVERRTGKTWQDLVREKVLLPLGLVHTSTSIPTGLDVAERYASVSKNVFRRLPVKTSRSYHAAGGMSSTLSDLVSWLLVNMNHGTLGTRQVFPSRVMQELHAVQIRTASVYAGFRRVGYGLGWYVVDYDGELMVQCFGSHAGTRVHLSYLPGRGVGVVVIANEGRDGVYLPDVIAHGIYDLLLNRGELAERQRRRFEEQRAWILRVQDDRRDVTVDYQVRIPIGPDVDASRFVGTYRDSLWGDVVISLDRGGLLAQMGELQSYLNPTGGLIFTADLTPGGLPSIQTFEFAEGAGGKIRGFRAQFGRTPTTFERVGTRQ